VRSKYGYGVRCPVAIFKHKKERVKEMNLEFTSKLIEVYGPTVVGVAIAAMDALPYPAPAGIYHASLQDFCLAIRQVVSENGYDNPSSVRLKFEEGALPIG